MKELYDSYRKLLFTLAYQLTGSVSDAEDAVQDVFLKFLAQRPEQVQQPKPYLCKMITNHCLDMRKSAAKQRELYYGPWLPEPISTPDDDVLQSVVRTELLSYAVLVLLERLSPTERAVYVLREAFRFEYAEIAALVDRSEANCRKILSRAKMKMGMVEDEPELPKPAEKQMIVQFIQALEQGEVETVLSLLAQDVTLISDGGGHVVAAVHPIRTSEHVLRFLSGLLRQAPQYAEGIQIELAPINNQTGIIVRSGTSIETVSFVRIEQGVIKDIYMVRNPYKLQRIE